MWLYVLDIRNAKEKNMTQTNDNIDAMDILETLNVDKIERRTSAGGAWVKGTLGGFRFDALVFPEHAVDASFELNNSRISKLWLQRISDRTTVANFDRGWDVQPTTPGVNQIIDLLCEGLADLVW